MISLPLLVTAGLAWLMMMNPTDRPARSRR